MAKPTRERIFAFQLPGKVTLESLRSKHICFKQFQFFDRKKYWKVPMMLSFMTTQCWNTGQGWARIYHKTFYGNYGREDSKTIKQYLRRIAIIMYDNDDYKPGEYTTAYYCDEPDRDLVYVDCPELASRNEQDHANNMKAFMEKAHKGMRWVITSILEHLELGVGVDAALMSLDGQTKQDHHGKVVDMLRHNAGALAKLNGITPWSPSIGAKGGRLYHPISGMCRLLRNFIILNGGPTVSLDVKSCFPYLCLNLYTSDCAEKQKYYQLLQDGFYEWVISLAPERFAGLEGDQLRDEAKRHVFANILFSKKGQHRAEWLWRPFCLEFPKLSAAIAEADSLAATLQQTESKAVYDAVAKLADIGIPCITVHDCLIVPEDDEVKVFEILREELLNVTGYEPVITTYRHQPPTGSDAAQPYCDRLETPLSTLLGDRIPPQTAHYTAIDYPTDNFSEEEKTVIESEFRKVVWRVSHGKWTSIRTEARKLNLDTEWLQGLLWVTFYAKKDDPSILAEWDLQINITPLHRRFRIDHKND